MSVKIYVEGGGRGADTRPKCREGFAAYFHKIVPEGRSPSVVVCGSRDQAFNWFETAVLNGKRDDLYALLVDSEGPTAVGNEVSHLTARDGWNFPVLSGHQVFLMVQAMEAWFLADREVLAKFYGDGFLAKSLPGSPTNIEAVPKGDLEPRLKHASKATKTKGEYHKTRHGFELLALIDPVKVGNASPHAASFHEFLRSL